MSWEKPSKGDIAGVFDATAQPVAYRKEFEVRKNKELLDLMSGSRDRIRDLIARGKWMGFQHTGSPDYVALTAGLNSQYYCILQQIGEIDLTNKTHGIRQDRFAVTQVNQGSLLLAESRVSGNKATSVQTALLSTGHASTMTHPAPDVYVQGGGVDGDALVTSIVSKNKVCKLSDTTGFSDIPDYQRLRLLEQFSDLYNLQS